MAPWSSIRSTAAPGPPRHTGLVEGSDTVQVRQTDVAGNVSAAGSLGFTFDTVAPAAPGVALANDTGTPGDLITSDPSLTLTGVETALGTLVEYSVNGGPWTATAPTGLVDGSNTVQVRQTDVAGNVSASGARLHPRHQHARRAGRGTHHRHRGLRRRRHHL